MIKLYLYIQNQDVEFFQYIISIAKTWNNLNKFTEQNIKQFLFQNMREDILQKYYLNFKMKHKLKKDFNNTTIRSAYYNYIRFLYNKEVKDIKQKTALFFFIRNFAYSGMQRFNKQGEFNTPYGGTSYNHKNLFKIIDFYKSKELKNILKKTTIYNLDFQDFLKKILPNITTNDFVFLDPPYDTVFSSYEDNIFDKSSHILLKETLKQLPKKVKWLIIINNSDFIFDLYKDFNVREYSKNYSINFKGRNDGNVKHLAISNY